MRIAMVQESLRLPARTGADLHLASMARALIGRGHDVALLTWRHELDEEPPAPVVRLAQLDGADSETFRTGPLRWRLRRHQGVSIGQLAALRQALREGSYEACVATNLEGLLLLEAADSAARIWYAADEIATYAASMIRLGQPLRENYARLAEFVAVALIERCFRRDADAVWMVADKDRRRMDLIAGGRSEVIANGVDSDYFRPLDVEAHPHRAAFWGALHNESNVRAVEWLIRQIWPGVRSRIPDAELLIIGASPSDRVRSVTQAPGVTLLPDLPDLRQAVCSAAVAVYPFQTGSGIKNKLLEGAAMQRALVATPRAVDGLQYEDERPWSLAETPSEWIAALESLFRNESAARQAGERARAWVCSQHSWDGAAALAESSIHRALRSRSTSGG